MRRRVFRRRQPDRELIINRHSDVSWSTDASLPGRVLRSLVLGLLLLGQLFPTVLDVSVAVVALALAIPLIIVSLLRELPIVHGGLLFVVVVFAPFFVCGRIHPPVTQYGQEKYSHLVTVTLISALAALILRDRRDLEVFAITWIGLACVLALATLLGETSRGRAVGFGSNPIWLARSMGSAFVASVWLYRQRSVRVVVVAPVAGLLLLAALATGSRGPIVATAAATALVLGWGSGRNVVRILAVAGTVAMAFSATRFLSLLAGSRIASFLSDPSAIASDRAREYLLSRTLPVIAGHPGGIGFGNWSYATGIARFKYPHNIWVEVLAEGGWAVGAMFIAIVAGVLVCLLWRARTDSHASLALGLLTFESVAVSVSGDVNARTFFAMLTVGFLTAVGRLRRRPSRGSASLADDAGRDGDGRDDDGALRSLAPNREGRTLVGTEYGVAR